MTRVRGRRRMAAFALLLFTLLATGCAVLDAMRDTEAALEAEGFRDASVSWSSYNGVETVLVSWTSSVETVEGAEAEGLRAAGVIWRVAPIYFDLVETDPMTRFPNEFVGTRVFPRAQLEQEFGPRAPGLDEDIGELANVRAYVMGLVGAVIVAMVLVTVIVVVLVKAAHRRRPAQPQRTYPPPGSGWQQPGAGWPQQPGAGWPQGSPPPPGSGWPQGPPPPPGSGWPQGPPPPPGSGWPTAPQPPPQQGWPREWPPSQGAPSPAPPPAPPAYADPAAPPPDDPWRAPPG